MNFQFHACWARSWFGAGVLILIAVVGLAGSSPEPHLGLANFFEPDSFVDEFVALEHEIEHEFPGWARQKVRVTTPMCNPRNGLPPPNNSLPLCCVPVGELPSGRSRSGNVEHETLFPSWINLTLARQGQSFARKNRMSVTIAAALSLVVGLGAPDARDLLAFTGNSDTSPKAFKRYVATAAQMLVWFDEMFSDDVDDNLILESIAYIRRMHLRVVVRASAVGRPLLPPNAYSDVKTDDVMWDAISKDLNASPLREYSKWSDNYTKYESSAVFMNQFVQGATELGFMGYVIMDPEAVFIWDATEHELKSYMHLWAIIGYMIGVEDEFNVNLQPSIAEAAEYARNVQNLYILPTFFNMDKVTKVMMESLALNIDSEILSVGLRRVMYMILTTLFKIPAPNLRSVFTPANELTQLYWETIFVPLTRLRVNRLWMNRAFQFGFETVQTGLFGIQMNRQDVIANVHYTQPEDI